jgi:hypothetical protein
MQPKRFLTEHIEHLSRGPLAGLHPSVEIPLAVRRGVFPGEQRVPLGLLSGHLKPASVASFLAPRGQESAIYGVLRVGGVRDRSWASDRTKDR